MFKKIIACIFGLTLLPLSAQAVQITPPFVFSPNTTIYSSQVNSNFSTVYNAFNTGIDNTNIGSGGIYASQLNPTNASQATFGGTQTYTFPVSGNGTAVQYLSTTPFTYPNTAGSSSITYVRGDNGFSVQGISDTVFGLQSAPTGGTVFSVDSTGNLGVAGALKGASVSGSTFTGNSVMLSGTANGVTMAHDVTNAQSGGISMTNGSGNYSILATDSPNQLQFYYSGSPILRISSAGAINTTNNLTVPGGSTVVGGGTTNAAAFSSNTQVGASNGFTFNTNNATTNIAQFLSGGVAESQVTAAGAYTVGSSTYGPTSATVNGGFTATTGNFTGTIAGSVGITANAGKQVPWITGITGVNTHIEPYDLPTVAFTCLATSACAMSGNAASFTNNFNVAPKCTATVIGGATMITLQTTPATSSVTVTGWNPSAAGQSPTLEVAGICWGQ